MREHRVWFSDNFQSLARLLPGLDASSAEFGDKFGTVWKLVTSASPSFAGASFADKFEIEPSRASFKAYSDWVLDLIVRYGIQYVVPGKRRRDLIKLKSKIEALPGNPKLLVAADEPVLSGLDNKEWTFSECALRGCADVVPLWRSATGSLEIKAGLDAISNAGVRRVCVKPVVGIYGKGFRFVSSIPARNPGKSLLNTPPHRVSLSQLLKLGASGKHRVLCMPLLRGPELSVDCFANSGALVTSFCRVKRGRTQRAEQWPEVVQLVGKLVHAFKLDGFFNVQLRHDVRTKSLKLLEINPRLAGGTSYGQAAGFDLVYWALAYMGGYALKSDFPSVIDGTVITVKPSRLSVASHKPCPYGECQ